MIAKSKKPHLVEFFATARLAQACRGALKQNRSLGQIAGIHELGHSVISPEEVLAGGDSEVVVLSHAEEGAQLGESFPNGSGVAKAFHLLLVEPTTHPGQIAQWMRASKIRSESRFHAIKIDNLQPSNFAHLLRRICFACGKNEARGSIIDAYLTGEVFHVLGPKHRILHVPVDKLPPLKDLSREVLRAFEVDPDGSFVHWPGPDIHLGWTQFLQAINPEELRKARQQTEGFNSRYGAAIRKLRVKAGIPQSRVEGLTERQVRRIEQGECRATSAALKALAAAHGLDANHYMDQIAKAMTHEKTKA